MLLRRISSLLLLFAVSTGLASYAVETTTKSIKRAPIAKPFKTAKHRASKHSSGSTKTASRRSASASRTATTAATKTALSLHPKAQLVRVIQFGAPHTAGDTFTGALRTLFQQKFGDGGAGFTFAGYPFAGYHIHGTKRAQSTGWLALGTHLNDIGDGMVGMGGVSLRTEAAGNLVSLDADPTSLQAPHLLQPHGGSIQIR